MNDRLEQTAIVAACQHLENYSQVLDASAPPGVSYEKRIALIRKTIENLRLTRNDNPSKQFSGFYVDDFSENQIKVWDEMLAEQDYVKLPISDHDLGKLIGVLQAIGMLEFIPHLCVARAERQLVAEGKRKRPCKEFLHPSMEQKGGRS